jgi:hypothetical protein
MDPITIGAIAGLLMGGVKAHEKAQNAKMQSKIAAERDRYSPWTGLKGQLASPTTPLGDMFSGALTGASVGQSYGSGGSGGEDLALAEEEDDGPYGGLNNTHYKGGSTYPGLMR